LTTCDGAPAASVMLPEVTPVTPSALKLRVLVPTSPLSTSPLKVAVPFRSVVAVVPPERLPPPDATAAVTTTPTRLTGLLFWSRS